MDAKSDLSYAIRGLRSALMVAIAAAALAACQSQEPDQAKEESSPTATSGEAEKEPTPSSPKHKKPEPSVRLERDLWRSLLRDAHRAELYAAGAWIDLGGPTGDVYTLGQWTRGWSSPTGGDGRSLFLTEPVAWLALAPNRPPPAEMVARVKGRCPGQQLQVVSGSAPDSVLEHSEPSTDPSEVDISNGVKAPEDWDIVRVPVPELEDPARIGLAASDPSCEAGETLPGRLSVDWIFLADEKGGSPPKDLVVSSVESHPTVGAINIGDRVRRGLAAPGSRTWRFYLRPPQRASLVVDMGTESSGTEFAVRVLRDGHQPEVLFSATPEPGDWRETDVDLSAFSGELVALELVTTATTGDDTATAGWGEPSIMVPIPSDEARAPEKDTSAAPDTTGGSPPEDEPQPVPLDPTATARNVIFIVIDTARADAFGPIPPETVVRTPEYDELAAEGAVFTAAWNAANWTKPSVASMLSGLYPFVHGAQSKRDMLPKEVGLISESMQDAGFETGGFVSNGFISSHFGFERGWDRFTNYPREELMGNARNVYTDAWEWIKAQHSDGKRVFAYIQVTDPHVPYWVGRRWSKMYYPDSYKGIIGDELDGYRQEELSGDHEQLTEDDYKWIRALYFGEITYQDYHMGLFFDRLGSLDGFLDDTLVVVTNDHGEEVDDHGQMGHGHSLFDELLRAPLTMVFPRRIPAGTAIDVLVESVDIPVTILELAGIEPVAAHQGLSLAPLWESDTVPEMRRDSAAVATWRQDKRALRYGRWKLIRSNDGGWVSLFDVADDPGETRDQAESHPIARRACALRLADAHALPHKLRRFEGGGDRGETFEARPTNLDPALEKQLEALGYFGD